MRLGLEYVVFKCTCAVQKTCKFNVGALSSGCCPSAPDKLAVVTSMTTLAYYVNTREILNEKGCDESAGKSRHLAPDLPQTSA